MSSRARAGATSLPLILLAFSTLPLDAAAPAGPPAPRARTDAVVGRLIRGEGIRIDAAGRRVPISRDELRFYARFLALDAEAIPPTLRVLMHLEPDAHGAVEAKGIRIEGRAGDLASASVPLPLLPVLAATPGVESIQAFRRARPELDVSIPEVGADQSASMYNARGAGVVVGLVDSGIDFTHGDFRNDDGSTRIRYLWNQTDDCGNPPAPFTYGCLYTETEINDFLLLGMGTIVAPNADGHGTHVAGIAAGDGSQTGNGQPAFTYVGTAPEADLIAVKHVPEPADPSCAACAIGDGLTFIDQKADLLGKPWVANVSLGQDFGGHDGSDPDEMIIDALTGPGIPGQAVVKSAGNNRGFGIHVSGTVSTGTSVTHTFTIQSYTPNPEIFDDVHVFSLWYDSGDNLTVTVTGPTGGSFSNSTGGIFDGADTPDGAIIIDPVPPPPTDSESFWVQIDDQLGTVPRAGGWTVQVTGNSITQGGRYDAWIWMSDLGGGFADWDAPDLDRLLTIPGTAVNVTAVAGYVTKTVWDIEGGGSCFYQGINPGELGAFSSPGPTRDDRAKPEIAAPAQGIVSSLSIDTTPAACDVVPDGEHWILAGSSFAAPHVTGVYAQMLGLNPSLDATQLRSLIQFSARADGFTGPVPNDDWGSGKLDALAALELLVKPVPDLGAGTDNETFSWSPTSTANRFNVYRGDLALLDGTFYGTCFVQLMPGVTSFQDASTPSLGAGFFYLITGRKAGIEGLLGFRSDGTVRPNGSPCP